MDAGRSGGEAAVRGELVLQLMEDRPGGLAQLGRDDSGPVDEERLAVRLPDDAVPGRDDVVVVVAQDTADLRLHLRGADLRTQPQVDGRADGVHACDLSTVTTGFWSARTAARTVAGR